MQTCTEDVHKILCTETKVNNAICMCRIRQQKMHIWLLSRHTSATGVAMIQHFSFCGQYMELTCCKRADMLAKPSLPKMYLLTKAVCQKVVKTLCQCRSKTACCTDTAKCQMYIKAVWPGLWVALLQQQLVSAQNIKFLYINVKPLYAARGAVRHWGKAWAHKGF